ncbi:hypothetical protein [Streptomyces sp. NPDC059893]|uniref:hypothetical protein n=1 Tax=Streptomyces sp. NPDC059893 TaxID=3346990 RepID=UPI0036565F19
MSDHKEEAAALLTGFAANTDLEGWYRVEAVKSLVQLAGHDEDAADLMFRCATDTAVSDMSRRAWAARDLTEIAGHRETGVALLAGFATDVTPDGGNRAWAARALAMLEEGDSSPFR